MSRHMVDEMMAANRSNPAPSRGVLLESLKRAAVTLRLRLGGPRGCQGLTAYGILSFSLVRCVKVFFLFNIQLKWLPIGAPPPLLALFLGYTFCCKT